MTGHSTVLRGLNAVNALFIKAIQNQGLEPVARKVLSDGADVWDAKALHQAQEALRAVDTITAEMANIVSDIHKKLSLKSIHADTLGPSAKQFHSCDIRIRREDLGTVLAELADLDFRSNVEITPARRKVLEASANTLKLIRRDEMTSRVILHLDPMREPGPFARFSPGVVDMAVAALPEALWPLYFLSKPVRLLQEKLSGKRSPHHEVDYLGTPHGLIEPVLEGIGLASKDTLIDVGCGDGRVVIKAAETFKCQAVGVEFNPDQAQLAKENAAASSASGRISIHQANAVDVDLSIASVVFLFLPKSVLAEVLPDLRARLRPDAKIVMHEQAKIDHLFAPSRSFPVFNDHGITVVHEYI